MKECKADILRYRLPLKHPLLLKQSSLDQRAGLILTLSAGGRFGYGEIAPLPGFSRESLEESEVQLQSFVHAVNEGRFHALAANDFVTETFLEQLSMPSVSFGIESALWWLNQDDWVSPLITAPLLQGPIEEILLKLEQWQGDWPKEFKLKTGRDALEEDCSRIRQVLKLLPDSVNIKLDANQRWSLPEALWLASSIDTRRISYVEEPTTNAAEFSEIYEKTGLSFALDETVQSPGFQLQPMSGLAAIVIKPTLVGGLRRCQELVNAARIQGIRAVFSSSYESPIGLHVLQQLSAQWTPEELPGLDTASAFTHSLISEDIAAGSSVSINSVFCEP
ncbi:o-succinylbenzoate synthase [Endozoicomonas sp.]|uniref:o-succinylbenzoate synthase n=1 Tax=Endozoicomonas sp. TaxID=1892382 RepID=UPI00383B8107